MHLLRALAFCLFAFANSFAWARPAYNGAQLKSEMSVYMERNLVIFALTNTTDTNFEILITPGPDMNLFGAKSARGIITSGQTLNFEVKFDAASRTDAVAVIDYTISYGPRGRATQFRAFNRLQFFVKSNSSWIQRPVSIQNAANLKFVKTQRPEPMQEGQFDLGAGVVTRTSLMPRDFAVDFDLKFPPGAAIPIRTPKALSESLAFKALPRSSGFAAGGQTLHTEKALQHNILEDGPINCAGQLKCITGELQVLNTLNEGITPGWGWRVEAWDVQSSPWKMLSATEVDGQGKWVLPIGLNGFPVSDQFYIVYKTSNRYIEVRDPSTKKPYQWGFLTNTYATKKAFIMPNKSLTGVGRVYNYANKLWHKLALNGINPIGKTQNVIYYPNSLDSNGKSPCVYGDGSKDNPIKAWSCSYGSEIYLIPEHANQTTVAHELAHNLHSLFWTSFPPGGSIDHDFGKCYNPGLALIEGFADFLPWWLESTSSTTPNMSSETYFKSCALKGTSDEISVAATFWDLYDNAYDTRLKADKTTVFDQVFYNRSGDVIADFLKSSGTNSMNEYKDKISGYYVDFKSYFLNLFDLNDTANAD